MLLPMLSTETVLRIWLSTENYGFRPSSTAVDGVSIQVRVPSELRKMKKETF